MAIENPYLKFINEDGSINKDILEDSPHSILNNPKQLKKNKVLTPELQKRNEMILSLYNQGHKQIEIAKKLGISRERVRQLLPINAAKTRAQQKKEFIEYYNLVKNVLMVLRQFIIWSRHDLRGYRNGCRCEICTEANKKYANQYYYKNSEKRKKIIAKWIKDNPDKTKKYRKKWKEKRLQEHISGIRELPHSKLGYTIGCRCPICTAANTNSKRKYKKNKK